MNKETLRNVVYKVVFDVTKEQCKKWSVVKMLLIDTFTNETDAKKECDFLNGGNND